MKESDHIEELPSSSDNTVEKKIEENSVNVSEAQSAKEEGNLSSVDISSEKNQSPGNKHKKLFSQ